MSKFHSNGGSFWCLCVCLFCVLLFNFRKMLKKSKSTCSTNFSHYITRIYLFKCVWFLPAHGFSCGRFSTNPINAITKKTVDNCNTCIFKSTFCQISITIYCLKFFLIWFECQRIKVLLSFKLKGSTVARMQLLSGTL